MRLLQKIRSFFRKSRIDAEMSEEMRHHVELQTELNLKAGINPDEARYAALRQFGNVASIQERARDGRGWVWLEQGMQDLRYAIRQLFKAPRFAAIAILTIAIGIGACTALFSVVNGVLLRPLSFPHPEQIVILSETRPPKVETSVAPAVYLDWVKQASVFDQLAAVSGRSYHSMSDGHGVKINAQTVTAGYFAAFGVQPILGRAFSPEEEVEGNNRVVILSHRFWQSHFGGRKNILNETILLDDQTYSIVGVMPDKDLLWNPAVLTPKVFSIADRSDYGSHGLVCVGRLKPGVSLEEAQSDLDAVSRSIAEAHPETNLDRGARVAPLLSNLIGDVRQQLLILLGAVGLLLVIAGVNVTGLLLARAGTRSREIAVRAALGASRGRIMRQFLCEGLLITMAGGILGTMIAYGSLGALVRFASRYVPRTDQIQLDGAVLALTIGLMFLTGIGVGLAPAMRSTRGVLTESLKDAGKGSTAGRRRQYARTVLVVVEIALALVLLTGTGLLGRSLLALQRADQGFKSKNVYLTQFSLGMGKRYDAPEKVTAFASEAMERISALPQVHSAALTTGQPMIGFSGLLFTVVGAPEVPVTAMPLTHDAAITPDYFETMSIPLIRGRVFTARDVSGAPRVVIISEELARRYFSGVDPIGQRLMIMSMADKPDALREIVGVVGNIKHRGPQSEMALQVYEPLAQRPEGTLAMVVRGKGSVTGLPVAVTGVIHTLDPHLPFPSVRSYDLTLANAWSRQQFSLIIFMLFSAIALLFATIGIYGVMAYSVEQRTQEIGIRMALGARAVDVLCLVIGSGARIVAAGLLTGIAGSLAFGRIIQALLFNTSPFDLLTLLATVSLLAVVAFFACWLPARRATKVDPMVALRAE